MALTEAQSHKAALNTLKATIAESKSDPNDDHSRQLTIWEAELVLLRSKLEMADERAEAEAGRYGVR